MLIDKTLFKRLTTPETRRRSVVFVLQLQGKSLSQIAGGASVSRQCLYHAFEKPYPRMERLIADALGMTAQELFSERYDEAGLPINRKGRPRKKISCHGKKDTVSYRIHNTRSRRAA